MTRAELQKVIQDPETPMIELQIASTLAQAAKSGDYGKIAGMLERAIGKVKEPAQDHNFNFTMMPRMEVIELGKEAVRFLEARQRKRDEE